MNLRHMDLKDSLRKEFRQKRIQFVTENNKESLDSLLSQNLLSIMPAQTQIWGCYKAYKSEVNVESALKQSKLDWVFPFVKGETLDFYRPSGSWILNIHGILEPDPATSQKVELRDIKAILIPGLAFDRRGYRMGSGKAHYDRTLTEFMGLKVGICYSCQVSEKELPRYEHDIPMDVVVTEKEVFSMTERIEL